jgi:membrane associated rhomboid family serine protease
MTDIRPGAFQQLPVVVKNLVIINVLVFMIRYALAARGIDLDQYLGLYHWQSPMFRWWQPITHMFMHGSIGHIFFNMFALWMFGRILENVWGPQRFLIFYLVCGLGAAACQLGVITLEVNYFQFNPAIYNDATIGASGAVMGLLFAFGYLFPNTLLYVYFAIPVKAKWFVAAYAAIELFSGVRNSAGDNVAHFAHLGGMLFAFILLRIWKQKNRTDFYQ